MSQNVENVSLLSLASLKGTTSRDGSDMKAKNYSDRATRKGGFDGFLQTFLGNDTSRKSLGGSSRNKGPGSGLPADQKQAIKDSLGKTVPGEGSDDPDVAAAAQEAADILWNLLYGSPAAGGGSASNALQYISSLIKSTGQPLYGTGSSGINLAAMQDAIETANASAEMNSAAVISALDGLLDGLPQGALETALLRTATSMGYSVQTGGSLLNQIASALDAELISVEQQPPSGGNLLSLLSGTAVRQSAEIAGGSGQGDGIVNLLNAFLQEKGAELLGENGIADLEALTPEEAESFLTEFSTWIRKPSNANHLQNIQNDAGNLLSALTKAVGAATGVQDGEISTIFSEMASRLESALHSSSSMAASASGDDAGEKAIKTSSGDGTETGQNSDNPSGGEAAASQAGQAAASGSVQSAEAADGSQTMSTMLDQIDNIERLAEAMKIARRNGGVTNLTMQLAPAELGQIMLRVESKKGVVSAHIRVEKKEAVAELTASLERLRKNLEAQGIEVGDLTIVERRGDEALGDFGASRDRERREQSFHESDGPGDVLPGREAGGDSPGSSVDDGGGGLNVFG